MSVPTVLVVEDNPITRKMLAGALRTGGYAVLEAGDGQSALGRMRQRPGLVIQDLLLPDMEGLELVTRLRALPEGADIPILCCSGFLSRMERARALNVGFTDYLFKPVEPSKLIRLVEAYLPRNRDGWEPQGRGRRILLVDDDPVQLTLGRTLLRQAGFQVVTAVDGVDALEAARRSRPDAILSDVLMPRTDGFGLCRAIRHDPNLATVPIVLVSSVYSDDADRTLAATVGAQALVVRSPDLSDAIEAVRLSLNGPLTATALLPAAFPTEEHGRRLAEQLDRHVGLNQSLLSQLALQGAELGMLRGLTETLKRTSELPTVLQETVYRCVDAAGVSRGLAYLVEPDGRLELHVAFGCAEFARGELQEFFGHADFLRQAMESGATVEITWRQLPSGGAVELLERAGAKSALIAPFPLGGGCEGVIVLLSHRDRFGEEWTGLIETVCAQLSQVVALSRALARVEAAERHYRSIFEHAVEGIFQTTPEGRFLIVNPAMARIFGYASPEEMIGAVGEIGGRLSVDAERWAELTRLLGEHGQVSRHESEMRRKDGSVIWTSLSVHAVRDERGEHLYYEGLLQDITERRRAEAALRQNEKLAAMGSLLASVAHELNNPLSVVLGHAQLLRLKVEPPALHGVEKVVEAAERCARVVKHFLALARQQPPERRQVDLCQTVRDAAELLEYPLRVDSVEVLLDLAPDLPTIWADPDQLHQVVVNLVMNAHQAVCGTPRPRRLTITTRWFDVSGPRVSLEVADTGPGIPPEVQARLFEPFFTTKPPGQGTGLGLSLCHGIVHDHGGTITAANAPDGGAVFRIELPVVSSPAAERPPAAAEPLRVVGQSILVVDDEPEILEILSALLVVDGHRVAIASNGAIALRKLENETFDLIVSDIKMPELDGTDLYRHLQRAVHPLASRFVFVTGDAIGEETRAFLRETGAVCLRKPFVFDEVRRVVSEALRRGRA